MRKWHRWLAVFFGVFLLWISVTGVLSHVAAMYITSDPSAFSKPPEGFVCPETMNCRPKLEGGKIIGLLHHLHSGESLGLPGTILSILSGLALAFFSFSGIWVYVQMWQNRNKRTDTRSKLFWK